MGILKRKKKTNRLQRDIAARRDRLMRASVNLLVLAVVLLAIGWGLQRLYDPQTLPLSSVQIRGEFKKVSEQVLREAVQPGALKGFFTTDVEAVRERVRALPWVEDVAVRRVWPDRLSLTVIEQQAVARWNGQGLLNARGEVFTPAAASYPQDLPLLEGPEGSNVVVLEQYLAIQDMLAGLARKPVHVLQDARRAWRVELDNGLRIALGREQSLQRLQRFTRVYAQLFRQRADEIDYIDLRYTNGLAVRWTQQNKADSTAQLRKGISGYVEKS
ncbi:MAG: cell division protein FtsQ/DivIB [Granulosicoccaceae bacterium]|jgi:cell division protein FtsQ